MSLEMADDRYTNGLLSKDKQIAKQEVALWGRTHPTPPRAG